MPFRGVSGQLEYDDPNYLEKSRREILANVAAAKATRPAPKTGFYPGAKLYFHEASSIEHDVVNRTFNEYRVDVPHDHALGDHSLGCWSKQRQQLWTGYGKTCQTNMIRTGKNKEPLHTENLDVPAYDKYYYCICGGTSITFKMEVFAGSVSFKKG